MQISVIIPIYNAQQYLAECLDSVWRNVASLNAEILLVDDGSTDDSALLAQQFARMHEHVHYYHQSNAGPSAARNLALQHAKGTYLFFVDADDVLLDCALPIMLKAARSSRAEMTVCDVGRLQPDGSVTGSTLQTRAFGTLSSSVTSMLQHPQLAFDSITCNKLIERQFFLRNAGGFPVGQDMCEDYTVMLPLYCKARKVSVVRTMGYLWRVREEDSPSLSQRRTELKNLTDRIRAIDAVFQYLDGRSDLHDVRNQVAQKLIQLDFNGHIANLHAMEHACAQTFVDLMASTVEKHVGAHDIAQAPLKARQMMKCLLERDVAGLIAWDAYVHDGYAYARFERAEDSLLFHADTKLITIESHDALPDVQWSTPLSYVDAIEQTDESITILGHLYTPRISISSPDEQKVLAFLINDVSGAKMPLDCTSCICAHLTESKGTIASPDGEQVSTYNYDGTGFSIHIDLAKVNKTRHLDGNNFIILEYENWIKHDFRVLRGGSAQVRKLSKKKRYWGKRYKASMVWDVKKTPILHAQHLSAYAKLRHGMRILVDRCKGA